LQVKPIEKVEKILAKRVCRKTQGKYYFEYLVKWKNTSLEDASWTIEEESGHLQWPSSLEEFTVQFA